MIERKIFLEMCQRCAVLPRGTFGIKENVPNELKILYQGIPYYPVGYEMFFDDMGNPNHSAILHDLTANSIIRARLQDIDLYEQNKIDELTDKQRELIVLFSKCNMNVSETARSAFIHRNAVTYNFDKICEKTGLDPRKYLELERLLNSIRDTQT